MAWEKINEMFPHGGTHADDFDHFVTVQEIKDLNLPYICLTMRAPVRNNTASVERMTWYADGSMDRFYIYNIYPFQSIDNTHIFNILGQKAKNDLCEEKGLAV